LVCADEASAEVLRRVLDELNIQVESCPDVVRAAVRLAQARFDLVILDGESEKSIINLLHETRASRLNDSSLTVAVVPGQENIRELFAMGVNFVLYKPVLPERAASSLRAAQAMLRKDKRRSARATVYTHATIDYAGEEQAKATLVDLAADGMAVHYGKKFPPTCKVYFQFQLPGQKADVRLSGQVVWQDWNGRAGIQFVDVPQASRRVLREWLQMSLTEAASEETLDLSSHVENALSTSRDFVPPKPSEKLFSSAHQNQEKATEGEAGARLRAEPANRRGKDRLACRIGAEVYKSGTSVRNYCHLSDLSPGGCYLEMPLALPVGTAIEITVRTHEMKLQLSGLVKASHPGYGVGVSFKLNTKEDRHGVQQLIDFVAATAESSS
jgi:CheY-like chemotaxis protein